MLLYFRDKVILVAWEYHGEYKCSFRSTNIKLPPIINKALVGTTGYGGGHDHAAGACVKTSDFKHQKIVLPIIGAVVLLTFIPYKAARIVSLAMFCLLFIGGMTFLLFNTSQIH